MSDELLDVVNDNDQVIAQETRSVVHRQGLRHRGVHVLLFTSDGKLLVQVRGRLQQAFPLALDCSISEHVKAGERYLQAARRGLLEELGLQRIRLYPMVKFSMLYGINDPEICTLYWGKVNPATVNFDPAEVERIAYYRLEELDRLIARREIPLSSWFIQIISWLHGRPNDMQLLKAYSPRYRLALNTWLGQ
jgi:isopentenyldiphosphate isomerase